MTAWMKCPSEALFSQFDFLQSVWCLRCSERGVWLLLLFEHFLLLSMFACRRKYDPRVTLVPSARFSHLHKCFLSGGRWQLPQNFSYAFLFCFCEDSRLRSHSAYVCLQSSAQFQRFPLHFLREQKYSKLLELPSLTLGWHYSAILCLCLAGRVPVSRRVFQLLLYLALCNKRSILMLRPNAANFIHSFLFFIFLFSLDVVPAHRM